MDENNPIKGSLQKRLGENELRTYLANKEETGKIKPPLQPEYVDFRKPLENFPKTVLANPSITIPGDMSKRCIPPLGLCYIAGFLESKEAPVSIIDCALEGYDIETPHENGLITYGLPSDIAAKRILSENPDVIGMSVLFSTDLINLKQLCDSIRRLDANVLIIVGGLHPTIYPKDVWDNCRNEAGASQIDFIIRGEGEERFHNLLTDISKGRIDVKMDGLCGEVDGEFFMNHQRTTIADLDTLPFPAYHLLPMERYFEINVPFSPVPKGERVVQLLTSRGCPIGCSFCASTNMYKKYRTRSVDNVIKEIEHWKSLYSVDEVQFADDNIFFEKKRTEKLFAEMIDENVLWCTPNGVMINTLSEDLIDLFKKSGLYQLTLSMDSGSAKTLKNLHHKPVNLNSIPGLVNKCNELGIFSHGTLVVGMPGETIEDIDDGFQFVNTLNLTSISVFIASAIPGSELYHQALENKLISRHQANRINTTKSQIHLSEIPADLLEKKVMEFQRQFSDSVKKNNPNMWRKKYARLIDSNDNFDSAHGGRLT